MKCKGKNSMIKFWHKTSIILLLVMKANWKSRNRSDEKVINQFPCLNFLNFVYAANSFQNEVLSFEDSWIGVCKLSKYKAILNLFEFLFIVATFLIVSPIFIVQWLSFLSLLILMWLSFVVLNETEQLSD